MKWSLVKIMNNILLDSTKSYDKEGTFKLELDKDTTINIESDNIKLYLVTKNNIRVDFNISNSATIYNITTENITINTNIYNNAKLDFYLMTITDKKITNEVNVYHQDKETTSNVICHGISYGKGDLKFSVNGYIKKGMIGSICNQSSRIINLDEGKSLIEPNLFVEEFDSIANHSAYTGPFDEKSLFYLETKGISRKEAFNLLLSGFMKLVDLPKEYKNILDMLLNKVMRR